MSSCISSRPPRGDYAFAPNFSFSEFSRWIPDPKACYPFVLIERETLKVKTQGIDRVAFIVLFEATNDANSSLTV